MNTLRLAGVIHDSIVDGEGVRDVLFLQGCKRACKGCHNPSTWNVNGGTEVSLETLLIALTSTSNPITISGGEPLLQFESLLEFLYLLKRNDCWLYTGYTFEELPDSVIHGLAPYVKVLVDGAYDETQKGDYLFRGSANQRLIDLRKSIVKERIVEYKPWSVYEDEFNKAME